MAPKALLFDVFGTTVDWRSSIIDELMDFGSQRGIVADWPSVADRWRAGFRELQGLIAGGNRDWITMDQIHREVLDCLLHDIGAADTPEDEVVHLNYAWRRLRPWPDSVEGLTRLRSDRTVGTLSNGNLSLLIVLSKHAGLPWDCVLSTAMFGTYKPNPAVYLGAAELLDADPSDVMMVAAHSHDVDGARRAGLQTAYVFRPDEFGPGRGEDPGDISRFDLVVESFVELSERLSYRTEEC